MSEAALQAAIRGGSATASFLNWLRNPQENDDAYCSRSDFACYFMTYLKTQTQQFLQADDRLTSFSKSETKSIEEIDITGKIISDVKLPDNSLNSTKFSIINDSASDKENSSSKNTTLNSTDNVNSKNSDQLRQVNILTPKRDRCVDYSEDKSKHIERVEGGLNDFATPQKSKSLDSCCLFSPVTPVNSVLSSNSDTSFVRFSTPNTSRSLHDSQKKTKNNSHDLTHTPKRTPSGRNNICIGDFLTNKDGNADNNTAKKKKKSTKFLNLSLNDPLFNSNTENSHRNERTNDLNIDDKSAFPDIGSKKFNNRPRGKMRRINPTRLNTTYPNAHSSEDAKLTSFGVTYDKTDENDAFKVQIRENTSDFKTERDILRMEKINLIEKFNEMSTSTPKKILTKPQPVALRSIKKIAKQKVNFDMNNVTHNEELEIFSSIFETLLDCNLVANVTSEIYYLMSIAILQHVELKSMDSVDDSTSSESILNKLFNSIDNCIYFALITLEKEKHLLSVILDGNSLRFLTNSQRIKAFSPSFTDFITEIYVKKLSTDEKRVNFAANEELPSKIVYFMTDTDSADNFPTHKSFISFKNLRDGFYEILRIWERDHNEPGWKFEINLARRVRSLLASTNCPVSFAHLARLFTAQLLMSCVKQDSSVEALAHLQSVIGGNGLNHNKLSKLAERLTGTLPGQYGQSAQNELSSPPEFLGQEEFFKEFIVHGSSPLLNVHLLDSFTKEILKLDDTGFHISENDDSNNVIDELKSQYLKCVHSLRILAKFLGFVIALPYYSVVDNSGTTMEKEFLEKEVTLRCQTLPHINLIMILRKSQKLKRLVLTIPWMVQLLAMLDYCSLRSSYFGELLNILFDIYARHVRNANSSRLDQSQSSVEDINERRPPLINDTLIRICLGWLFDMQHFPKDHFNLWIDNSKYKMLDCKAISDVDKINDHSESVNKTLNDEDIKKLYNMSLEEEDCDYRLDVINIIDDSIVREVCPFLKEFRMLLLRNSQSEYHNPRNVRHITPITSGLHVDVPRHKDRELQIRLEEWFLRSQPGTVRRTLELVGERTGSALVRLIKAQLPKYRQQVQCAVVDCISRVDKDSALTVAMETYNNKLTEFGANCRKASKIIALKRIRGALGSLLPPETPAPIVDVCIEICRRNAMKRLNHCLQTQYNTIRIFTNDIQEDVNKMWKPNSTPRVKLIENIEQASDSEIKIITEERNDEEYDHVYLSPTIILIELKEILVKLLEYKYDINNLKSDMFIIFKNIKECCAYEFIEKMTKDTMLQLTLQLITFIICIEPEMLDDTFYKMAVETWTACLNTADKCENESDFNEEIEHFGSLINMTNYDNPNAALDNRKENCDTADVTNHFNSVMCPRNVIIIGGYYSQIGFEIRWKTLSNHVVQLIKNGFITDDCFAEQCISLYRLDWHPTILEGLSSCIRDVASRQNLLSRQKTQLLLEFLSDFCENLDGNF